MNRAIFITVRSASTRLPNKCLLEINNLPNITRLIRRLEKSKEADLIVLCTTILPEDNILCKIALNEGIKVWRGSSEDKLDRWFEACQNYNVEFFVTADADDLLCEVELIDLTFEQHKSSTANFIQPKDLICGVVGYGIETSALEKVCQIKGTNDTEMMDVYFTNTHLFNVQELRNVPKIFKHPEIRMTLDYEEDFAFFKVVVETLEKKNKNFTVRDVVGFLESHPEVVQINQSLQAKFLAKQKAKTKLVLK